MALKILLADDSLTAQNMGKKILTEAGYEVIAVSNGAQAMKKIVSDSPDLVVLDVYMPGYSGLELCERMRSTRETATTPVVLSVGKMEAFQPEQGNRVRADGLIIKPFEATELLAVVKKLAENVSPSPRTKRRPDPEPTPEPVVEATPFAVPSQAGPEFEIQHQSVNIPREVASAPVVGMELIPDEIPEPAQEQQPAAAMEFELEQAPAPVECDAGPRMSPADGQSGVFEMEPAPPPAIETSSEPAPAEEFETFSAPAQSQQPDVPSAESVPTTVEHDFMAPPTEVYEAGPEFTDASPSESFSTPAAAEPPSSVEFGEERFEHAQPETSSESGSAPLEVLPELTPWGDASPSAEMPHVPADSMLNNSEPEVAPPVPVWIAQEVQIEPHEFATPLHQQMQRRAAVGEAPESAAVATPVESASEESLLPPASFPPPTSAAEAAAEREDCAADHLQPAPQMAVPMVTEAAVDPARIASIVDEMLQRLKPELIAAVTRELEKNGQ